MERMKRNTQKTVQPAGMVCIQLGMEALFRIYHKCPFIIVSASDSTLNNLRG
jgi:hypothetical protein